MQRTLVIYAAAAATLIGAFLLAPRIKEAPPEPPPPPAPEPAPDQAPITRLTYADGIVSVDAEVLQGFLPAGTATVPDVWMNVQLKATDAAERASLSAVLVVDRSGSMAGDKIDRARMAARRFVDRLQDGDQIALVTYGTDVSVDMPLTRVTSETRARARRLIDMLEEGGGTNIDGALRAARRTITNAGSLPGVARVVLVSDGRPTEGDRRIDRLARHASALRDAGATLSTLGLGLDYNDDLMERLAVDGSGRYHYLRKSSQLASILDDELKHATAVVARGLKLHVTAPQGLAFRAAPGVTVERNGTITTLHVGDLAAGETRNVLVRMAANPTSAMQKDGAALVLPAPEATYMPASDGGKRLLAHRADAFRMVFSSDAQKVASSISDSVRIRSLEVESSLAVTESMNAYREGNVQRAKQLLREHKDSLERVGSKKKSKRLMQRARDLDRVMQQVNNAPAPASAAGQDMIKLEKARAYDLRR